MIKYILKDKDDYNKDVYNWRGIGTSHEKRHFCVLCGHVTCIDDSFSARGTKLTCSECLEKYFNNNYEFFALWAGSDSDFVVVRENERKNDENNTENN